VATTSIPITLQRQNKIDRLSSHKLLKKISQPNKPMSQSVEATLDTHGHPKEYTSTCIPNKKLCMWAFLASECMFFGTLLSTHLVYRKTTIDVIDLTDLLDIPLTSFSTFILLASSLLMALGVSAMNKSNLKMTRWMLLGVIIFGLIFLGCQVYEFTHLVQHSGITLNSNIFGSTFYLLVGTYVVHITLGVVWLVGWLVYSFTGKMTPEHAIDIEVAGVYWHFIIIAWVIIFPVVYLTEYLL